MTTKLHVSVDALGKPRRLLLSPGHRGDILVAEQLLGEDRPSALIADKAYDADAFIDVLRARQIEPVIPSRRNRRVQRVIDQNLYCDRNKVERFFARLKQYRRVATRYDKRAACFLAFAHFVSILILLL